MATRILRIFIVLVVAVGLFGFVQAPTATAAVRPASYKGQITFYDEAGKQMVVNGKDGDRPFFVGNARIKGAIHLNENVLVRYSNKLVNGEMVATSVKVVEPRVSMKFHEAGDPDTTNGYGVQENPGN